MTSSRETFDEEMMNILKFTFKYFMVINEVNEMIRVEILREDPDINDDLFWDSWFPITAVRMISPPKWMNHAESIVIIMQSYNPRKTSYDDIIRFMLESDYYYDRYTSMDHNIGNYLFFVYNNLYKERIREWAQKEYLSSSK